jgi:REP element-mobilizing transposase RayT
MPRSARIDAPGTLHHVIGRGIERRRVFHDDEDRNDFLQRLSELTLSGAMDVYAWALMPNHFHILCKTRHQPLSVSMHRALTGYVVNFNRRKHRHGHLFQNRFKSIVCQEDRYFMELVRYVHLNPLRSNLVADLGELGRYPFCGHSAVLGRMARPWQATEEVLGFFGEGQDARRSYRNFIAAGARMGRRPELVGGGLIRSQGGWSEVLALRRREEKATFDQRILGDGDFVANVIAKSQERQKTTLRLSVEKPAIASVGERICQECDLSPSALRSGSRRRPVVRARGLLSWIAVREMGYSGAEVARYLGVTNSCVTRWVASNRKPDSVEDMRGRI